jgi:hypothetical protein
MESHTHTRTHARTRPSISSLHTPGVVEEALPDLVAHWSRIDCAALLRESILSPASWRARATKHCGLGDNGGDFPCFDLGLLASEEAIKTRVEYIGERARGVNWRAVESPVMNGEAL